MNKIKYCICLSAYPNLWSLGEYILYWPPSEIKFGTYLAHGPIKKIGYITHSSTWWGSPNKVTPTVHTLTIIKELLMLRGDLKCNSHLH